MGSIHWHFFVDNTNYADANNETINNVIATTVSSRTSGNCNDYNNLDIQFVSVAYLWMFFGIVNNWESAISIVYFFCCCMIDYLQISLFLSLYVSPSGCHLSLYFIYVFFFFFHVIVYFCTIFIINK